MAGLVTDSRVEDGGNRINGTIFLFSAAMSQRGIYLVFFFAGSDIGQLMKALSSGLFILPSSI
jgi:hypothetical protein